MKFEYKTETGSHEGFIDTDTIREVGARYDSKTNKYYIEIQCSKVSSSDRVPHISSKQYDTESEAEKDAKFYRGHIKNNFRFY